MSSSSKKTGRKEVLEFRDLVLENTDTVKETLGVIHVDAAPLQEPDHCGIGPVANLACLDTMDEARAWIKENARWPFLRAVAVIGRKEGISQTIRYRTLYYKNHE